MVLFMLDCVCVCSQFLLSLQLDASLIFPEPQRLPQALLEKCAAISVKPEAIKGLIDAMQCEDTDRCIFH